MLKQRVLEIFLGQRMRAVDGRGLSSLSRLAALAVCLVVSLCAADRPAIEVLKPEIPGKIPATASKDSIKEPQPQRLFVPAEFPKGWVFYSAEKGASLGATWKIESNANEQDAVLVCLGKPFGYLRTERSFENCQFQFEWKYPNDPNANSGILVFTNGPDMIWPQAVQVQLHRPTAGSVFPDGGARTEKPVTVTDLNLAVNEWHKCEISCRNGKLTVAIDGRKTAEVAGCVPSKGCFSIQSEGSEMHFRHIQVRPLP